MRGESLEAVEIQELAEVPWVDWHALFAGEADPFEIEHLHLTWRPKDTHFVLYSGGLAASHVSVLLRHVVRVGSDQIAVTGVAGVITRPDLRRRGLASRLLDHALSATRSRAQTSFALLFCLPKLVTLYRSLGWQEITSVVDFERPSGVVEAPLRTMVLALRGEDWPAGPLILNSPPW